MYLQITTRCNMKCGHCCYACGPQGMDMTLKTVRAALTVMGDELTAIGGGEPTLHPYFWQIVMECLAAGDVWVATNGKRTKDALILAKLAQKGILSAALSVDHWHERIDPNVVRAFTKPSRSWHDPDKLDYREIRDVSGKEIISGRCKDGKEGCVCEEIFVQPDGTVRGCGCADASVFGNVNYEVSIPKDWQYGECWKAQEHPVYK